MKNCYLKISTSEYRMIEEPFAASPYLCGSKLIEVTPSGIFSIGYPSLFFKNGTKNPPRHISM
jgi:hypothetical protein